MITPSPLRRSCIDISGGVEEIAMSTDVGAASNCFIRVTPISVDDFRALARRKSIWYFAFYSQFTSFAEEAEGTCTEGVHGVTRRGERVTVPTYGGRYTCLGTRVRTCGPCVPSQALASTIRVAISPVFAMTLVLTLWSPRNLTMADAVSQAVASPVFTTVTLLTAL